MACHVHPTVTVPVGVTTLEDRVAFGDEALLVRADEAHHLLQAALGPHISFTTLVRGVGGGGPWRVIGHGDYVPQAVGDLGEEGVPGTGAVEHADAFAEDVGVSVTVDVAAQEPGPVLQGGGRKWWGRDHAPQVLCVHLLEVM